MEEDILSKISNRKKTVLEISQALDDEDVEISDLFKHGLHT